jgi:hypothetical protein
MRSSLDKNEVNMPLAFPLLVIYYSTPLKTKLGQSNATSTKTITNNLKTNDQKNSLGVFQMRAIR